jgi:hypothetical protein
VHKLTYNISYYEHALARINRTINFSHTTDTHTTNVPVPITPTPQPPAILSDDPPSLASNFVANFAAANDGIANTFIPNDMFVNPWAENMHPPGVLSAGCGEWFNSGE